MLCEGLGRPMQSRTMRPEEKDHFAKIFNYLDLFNQANQITEKAELSLKVAFMLIYATLVFYLRSKVALIVNSEPLTKNGDVAVSKLLDWASQFSNIGLGIISVNATAKIINLADIHHLLGTNYARLKQFFLKMLKDFCISQIRAEIRRIQALTERCKIMKPSDHETRECQAFFSQIEKSSPLHL